MRAALALFFAVVMLWPTAAAEARSKPKPCPKRAQAQSWAATLYIRDDADGEYHELVACVKATRRRTVLASWYAQGSSTDDPAPESWLAGRFAAINRASSPADPNSEEPCTGTVRVIDLLTRRTYATVPAGSYIVDLVLTRRGSVGMIHRGELITAVGATVTTVDAHPQEGSLAYARTRRLLFWMSEGQARSVALP
jgi:hypothetical protein